MEAEGGVEKEGEESEEEKYFPPIDRILYYDFKTYDAGDPILLALMGKGAKDLL